MVRVFALGLLWRFSFPKERNGLPFFGHSCCPDQPPLSPGVPEQVIWCVLYPSLSCQLRALRTSVTHLSLPLPHTESHSTTTSAYESITRASTTGSTHAANGGLIALLVSTCPLWQT